MTIPKDFQKAYEGIEGIVREMTAGRVREEDLREEIDAWRREDCHGANSLAEAALHALKYELSSSALEGSDESRLQRTREKLAASGHVEAILRPPEADPGASGVDAKLVEVAVPEQLRKKLPNARCFVMGPLQITLDPLDNPPNAHLTVSHPGRYPTQDELRQLAKTIWKTPKNLWSWVPKPEQDTGSYVMHLFVIPPRDLLG